MAAALTLMACRAGAAECSLVVKVIDTNGTPVHAWIRVEESGGRHLEKRHSPGGVQFCDLGIRPVRVTVTPVSAGCSWSVSVPVDLVWDKTQTSSITVPAGDCEFRPSALILGKCRVLYRVMDDTGRWIHGARVTVTANSSQSSADTDDYGRALFRNFPLDSALRVTVETAQYESKTAESLCNTDRLEQMIEMRPKGHQ